MWTAHTAFAVGYSCAVGSFRGVHGAFNGNLIEIGSLEELSSAAADHLCLIEIQFSLHLLVDFAYEVFIL